MDAKSAVLSIIAIKPRIRKDLLNRLPYAKPTIYEAVRTLEAEGLLKTRDGLVFIGDGFTAKKSADLHILALSHGIDPEFIMKASTLSIWKTLTEKRTYKEIEELTGYSHVTVKKVLAYLKEKNMITFQKRKPVIAVRNDTHPVNNELYALQRENESGKTYHYPGTVPFREIYVRPEELEKFLLDRIDEGISVKDTGFMVKDDSGQITIVESTDKIPSLEEIFLKKLLTTEGVEDLCIKMLTSGKLDLDELISLSIENDMVSIVGCYLDILRDIGDLVREDVVDRLLKYPSRKRRAFLVEEKNHGKSGWEKKYENRWNVDLYLDLDAIKHGVRSA